MMQSMQQAHEMIEEFSLEKIQDELDTFLEAQAIATEVGHPVYAGIDPENDAKLENQEPSNN